MSRADYAIDQDREALVVHLIRERWDQLRRIHPLQRLSYTVGCMVCDPTGLVERDLLRRALTDPDVNARAHVILAVVRLEHDDGGEWGPP